MTKNTQGVHHALQVHLSAFAGRTVSLNEIDTSFCFHFARYLTKHVSVASARTYLQTLRALLTKAFSQGLIAANPMPPCVSLLPHHTSLRRASLTTNEIQFLAQTPCPHNSTKAAFLFACYTGLRLSDIETLTWNNLHRTANTFIVNKIQVKTHREVCVPLCNDALRLLSPSYLTKPTDHLFSLMSRTVIASDLRSWAAAARIDKHLTFHVSRHTFATLALEAGIDIAVISQLCGHANVKTTQNYLHFRETILLNDIKKLNTLLNTSSNTDHSKIDPNQN